MGLLIKVLNSRYGQPKVEVTERALTYKWNDANEVRCCVFFGDVVWDSGLRREFGPLEVIYGSLRGGSLLGGSLKVSIISGESVYGVYEVEALQKQPELINAKRCDPQIRFFMDASNVWFYGVKGQHLYVYDSATDELDLLGPLESAIEAVIAEWETTKEGASK